MVIRLLTLVVALVASAASSADAAQRFIPLLQPGDAIAPIPLVAQNGRPFGLADLHGNAVAVSFIYTRCRDGRMCPLVAAKFARAQHLIGSAPIRFVLLTLDPTYDTPRVLARYGRGYAQDPQYWTLATGAQTSIEDLAGRLGIATSVTTPGVLSHTEAAVVIAPDGRIGRTIYGNDWSPAELVDAARATLPNTSDRSIGLRSWLSATMERCGGGNLVIGGTAMLGVLIITLAVIGGSFWLAFRGDRRQDVSNS